MWHGQCDWSVFMSARRIQMIRSNCRIAALLALWSLFAGVPLLAQSSLGLNRRQATRGQLEQAVQSLDEVAKTSTAKTRTELTATASAIRQRLETGDFSPGDRILLRVLGDSMLTDTFTVRGEQKLLLPDTPEISLHGVLDSELNAFLKKELARYYVNPSVTAIGMVRVTLSGGVVRPGSYVVPYDQQLWDVIMAAGGPSPTAKIPATSVRRAERPLFDAKQFAEALRTSRTVGDVSLRDGDEIRIPDASGASSWTTRVAPLAGLITGLAFIGARVFN